MSPEKPVHPERSELAAQIAVRLRELRARHDLTQDEVATRIGCHESAISRWESGSRLPSCQDLLHLARIYRVSCDALLGHTEFVLPSGSAVLDQRLVDRLSAAEDTEAFDAIVEGAGDQTVWIAVEEGAVVVPVTEALRRAGEVAAAHSDSKHVGRLFRPRT